MKTNVMRSLGAGGIVAAGALLAGCSATHVGESWQCPLAQGTSCTTIVEADPAVPARVAQPAVMFGEPLREARRPLDGNAACDDGCDPFGWLRGLFGVGSDIDSSRPAPETPETAAVAHHSIGQDGAAPSAPPASTTEASLRVPEVLGRIWIAPFVDADGIYREAHWVRVVLEPAGWKLP